MTKSCMRSPLTYPTLVLPGITSCLRTTQAPPKDPTVHNLAAETVDLLTDTGTSPRQYPTQLRRSVTRYTPQTTFHTPRTTFLQLGEVQVHRSVVDTMRYTKAAKEERMHATTWTATTTTRDDMEHAIDKDLVMKSEDKFKVWAYVITQYHGN